MRHLQAGRRRGCGEEEVLGRAPSSDVLAPLFDAAVQCSWFMHAWGDVPFLDVCPSRSVACPRYYQLASATASTGCGDIVMSRFVGFTWSRRHAQPVCYWRFPVLPHILGIDASVRLTAMWGEVRLRCCTFLFAAPVVVLIV